MQAEKYISDEVLIRRVLEGQQEDFTLLVERHASPLLHFVGRMIPVREEAEEIVQDTLLAAYQRLNDFDVRCPASILYRMAAAHRLLYRFTPLA